MKKNSILIVEDDAIIGLDIKTTLIDIGYDVTAVVATGKDAIKKVEEQHPDLVLMDIYLSGKLDGIQTARIIKEKQQIPVVYLTGNADIPTVNQARETDPYGYICKPINSQDLFSTIDTALHRHELEIKRLAMEEALREERDKAKHYLDIAGVIIILINPDETVSLINKKGVEILEYDESEIIGKNWFDNFLPVKIKDQVKTVFKSLINGTMEPIEYFENPIVTKSGRERIIAWHNTYMKDEKGHILFTLSSGEDITVRKMAEEELKSLNRVYAVLSNVNQAIVRIRDRQKLMDTVCRILVDNGGFQLVWIAMADKKSKQVKIVSYYGISSDHIENLIINLEYTSDEKGPVGSAILDGRSVICHDIKKDELISLLKDGPIKTAYSSSASFPIKLFDDRIGALNIYSSDLNVFNEQEIKLFEELAGDISFSLEFIEIEERRNRAEDDLIESEIKLRLIFENSRDAIGVLKNGVHYMINPAFVKLFGYESDKELIGKPINAIIAPEVMDEVLSNIKKWQNGEPEPQYAETKGVRKDGSVFEFETHLSTYQLKDDYYSLAIIHDITEKKRYEEQINASLKEKDLILKEIEHRLKNNSKS